MTKQDICRAISFNLEPKPVHKPTHRINGVAVDIQGQRSKLGFWEYSYGEGWIPVDYLESEDASAKLLESMPEPELWLESRKDEKFRLWACWADLDGKPEDAYAHHADRKTAIVLAAMGWLGIEGEISK